MLTLSQVVSFFLRQSHRGRLPCARNKPGVHYDSLQSSNPVTPLFHSRALPLLACIKTSNYYKQQIYKLFKNQSKYTTKHSTNSFLLKYTNNALYSKTKHRIFLAVYAAVDSGNKRGNNRDIH